MTFRNAWAAAALLTLGLFGASPGAHATVIVNALVGGAPTGVSYVNFDNLALGTAGGTSGGVGVSFLTDGQVVVGATSGINAAPFLSNNNGTLFGDPLNGADTTKYITTGIGKFTLIMPGQEMYLGLLWGSVDLYNTLQLFNNATLVGTITGIDVAASANGNQGASGTYYVNINSSLSFNKVVATSTQYAFEVDNVAYNPTQVNVPEPASILLLAGGLIGFARVAHRRRKIA